MDRLFTNIAPRSANIMGQPFAFLLFIFLCIAWAISGPIFRYSDSWQLIINMAVTALTFLALFLIQTSQNRHGAAIQANVEYTEASVGDLLRRW